ncbi:hypothetical protein ACH9EU_15260 [Kocuria sp. M1R5S2]|uniref:hypothetical protein n=1 Tax=Kocuria rhizosphaerae TaxID=3376285 RepID=UPI0037AB2649
MAELSAMVLIKVISTACTTTGVALLVAALLVRCCYAWWVKTAAIHVHDDERHRLRWHTNRYELHEEFWPHPPEPPPPPGAEVIVYYHAHDPARWSLTDPARWTRFLAVVGVLLAATGFLVRFLPA